MHASAFQTGGIAADGTVGQRDRAEVATPPPLPVAELPLRVTELPLTMQLLSLVVPLLSRPPPEE